MIACGDHVIVKVQMDEHDEASILLSRPKLKALNKYRELDYEWYSLGVELEIDDEELDELEETYRDPHRRLIKMFGVWLEKGENPTYKTLLEALVNVNMMNVAQSICTDLGLTSPLDSLLKTTSHVKLLEPERNSSAVASGMASEPKLPFVFVSEGIDDYTHLDEDDFSAMLNLTSDIASKYQLLGTKLGISEGDLEVIHRENPIDIMRLGDVILKWLHGKDKPTWKVLVKALYQMDPKHAYIVSKKLRGKDKPFSTYGIQFTPNMSDEEFFAWLRINGVMEKDIKRLEGNGINAKVFSMLHDDDLAKLDLSFGGTKLFKRLHSEIQMSKTSPASGQSTSSMASREKCLKIDDLEWIMQELYTARVKWYSIGLQLGLKSCDLDEIHKDKSADEDCLEAMISNWLKVCARPMWRDLADALKSTTVGYIAVAHKLQALASTTTFHPTTSAMMSLPHIPEYLSISSGAHLDYDNMSKPGFSNLTVIRWRNNRGEVKKFRLKASVMHKWRDIGNLVVPRQQLGVWAKTRDDRDCCEAVLSHWLDYPPRHYPATWEGLYELLDDSELGQVATELKQAVDNAI